MRLIPGVAVCFCVAAIYSVTSTPAPHVQADSYVPAPYHFVCPPKWTKYTNVAPTGTVQTVSLSSPKGYAASVAPSDAQVDVEINGVAKTFGRPAGQRRVQVSIKPLRQCGITEQGLIPDGNVYGLRFGYLPSGHAISRIRSNLLITMDAPHDTPSNIMLGRFGQTWRAVCAKSTILYVGGLPACLTRVIPSEVAIFYSPNSHYGQPTPTPTSGTGIPGGSSGSGSTVPTIVIVIVLVLVVGGGIIALARRGLSPPQQ